MFHQLLSPTHILFSSPLSPSIAIYACTDYDYIIRLYYIHPALYEHLTNMTVSTPRNPPPQSPYYSNYSQNGGISPNNGTTKLPGVPEQSNGDETPTPKKEQRLIVVSNRLPVTIQKDANGEYQFAMSSGGLVSALSGCKKSMSFTWIGWPGKHVSYQLISKVSQMLTNRSLKPTVLLSKRGCWKSTAVTQYISQMTLPSSTTMVSSHSARWRDKAHL